MTVPRSKISDQLLAYCVRHESKSNIKFKIPFSPNSVKNG